MRNIHMTIHGLVSVGIFLLQGAAQAAPPWEARDLNPVTIKQAAEHAPLTLVANGKPAASIVVMRNSPAAVLLRDLIAEATGVELPIVKGMITTPAIVLGGCPEAEATGLIESALPVEGFAIRTTSNYVFIVGNASGGAKADGLEWGIYEFLERFVGVRWYFPPATEGGPDIGRDVPKTSKLIVPPVWLEDAPVFRLREMWPPTANPWKGNGLDLSALQRFLRSGSSWPHRVKVHAPNWEKIAALREGRPEVFQLKRDGGRQHNVLCYGNPKTLETYLESIQNFLDGKTPVYAPIGHNRTITVSPADVELACYCPDCRALWDENGGQYGTASRVMATFVEQLAREVLKRWPDEGFTIVYLPYLNYTAAPDGIKFPGNVEVQICGMPGMASYKEPAIRDAVFENLQKWAEISGCKVQGWDYNCWPAHKIKAAYQYPHVVQAYYQSIRELTVGSFINGTFNHWPRQHISLYCWLKVLWNPDFDVDAAMDTFCLRMFGEASGPMRELLSLQVDGWEQSRWSEGRFSPKSIYATSYPPETVARMKGLLNAARAAEAADTLVGARIAYCAAAFEPFFTEADTAAKGFSPLVAQRSGENPTIDGRLTEPVWQQATANAFRVAAGANQGQPARYATCVQATWTADGVTFGFHMVEPTPALFETRHGGHDNGEIWWDDNVEIFLDVTGKSSGDFYQFIVNTDGDYWDSRMKDTSWECEGFKAAAFVGDGFWSLEVFMPYVAFPEAVVPRAQTVRAWTGNFARHRVADRGIKVGKPLQEGSVREYQRMNTTGAIAADNLADFSEIQFVE